MKKTDLAYAAGILDGEGSISIIRSKRKSCKRGYTYSLSVQVCNSNEWICKWLQFAFRGSFSYTDDTRWDARYWHWNITGQLALVFLQLVLPYLHIKQSQAELAIQFQKRKKRQPNKSDEEAALEEVQRLLMLDMHVVPSISGKKKPNTNGWLPLNRQELPEGLKV